MILVWFGYDFVMCGFCFGGNDNGMVCVCFWLDWHDVDLILSRCLYFGMKLAWFVHDLAWPWDDFGLIVLALA